MNVKCGIVLNKHEQAPKAEAAGFDVLWLVDHFTPFSHTIALREPELAGNWSALPTFPVVLRETKKAHVGSNVICPGYRYHPAFIAQYFAQLDALFPNRIILGLWTGEAVNEVPFVGRFPPYSERRERLQEAIDIIRKLWKVVFVISGI